MENLTAQTFKEKIFDFENKKEWAYAGSLPVIVDFYADWCMPCKMVAPILEKIAAEYKERVAVYKVNTDKEPELSGVFGIQSIPSILFIPQEGQPQMAVGALSRQDFIRAITDILKVPSSDGLREPSSDGKESPVPAAG